MTQRDDEPRSGQGARRGLDTRSIRRGHAARLAIRTVRLARRAVLLVLEVLLAAIILFEEWGWQPLSAAIARLARIDLVARLEMGVRSLPPWPALGVFLVPSALFLPLKLLALWLIAGGHVVAATALFVLAKIAGTALYARIFQLTQPALMQLAWFAAAYAWFMPWKHRLIEHARRTTVWRLAAATSAHVKAFARTAWQRLRPSVMAVATRLRAVLGV
ncbi:MAG: hypothetical protein SFW09_13885 [Hyphomicrobiaceae bacterium]|nr:hypothetical protein [Hyphomicrobiaceae bacterium]